MLLKFNYYSQRLRKLLCKVMYNTTRVKIPEASVHTVLSYANVTRQNGKHVKAIGHNYGVLEEWSCVSIILNKSCVTPGINISTTAS